MGLDEYLGFSYFAVFVVIVFALSFSYWRRGLFSKSDFKELIESIGGSVVKVGRGLEARVNGVRVEAKFNRYLRDGPPFPRWHKFPVRKRPCGDRECMLCSSVFRITLDQEANPRDRRATPEMVVYGGSWEGMILKKRLEAAIAEAAMTLPRERARTST